jgi:SMODS and SLOG-associating 2TM effector domain
VASYLARTRGSSEPEFSILRTNALDHFVREIEGFTLDYGNEVGHQWDEKVNGFRLGFENILGNRPGSLAVKTEGGAKPGTNTSQSQEKGIDKSDAIAGLSGNE